MSVLCSGSFVADILVPDLPHIGSPGSLTYAPNGIRLSPGGHSANVAINLVQLEVDDVFAVGSIGKDEMGRFLVEQLKTRGVNPLPEVQVSSTTAKNVALLVKGEDRRYISELTANSLLSIEHLRASIDNVQPRVFYQGTLGGLPEIEKNLSGLLENCKGALNFIDVIMPSNGWGYLESACPHIDIFHANTLEAYNFTGKNDPHEAIRSLNTRGIKLVIISDAQNGVVAGTKDCHIEMPAFQVEQKDPTGAGDALSAGVLCFIKKNNFSLMDILETEVMIELLLFGQAAGAACVTGLGATTDVTMKKVKSILVQQRDKVQSLTRMNRQ